MLFLSRCHSHSLPHCSSLPPLSSPSPTLWSPEGSRQLTTSEPPNCELFPGERIRTCYGTPHTGLPGRMERCCVVVKHIGYMDGFHNCSNSEQFNRMNKNLAGDLCFGGQAPVKSNLLCSTRNILVQVRKLRHNA